MLQALGLMFEASDYDLWTGVSKQVEQFQEIFLLLVGREKGKKIPI